jgi:hypothetical protein
MCPGVAVLLLEIVARSASFGVVDRGIMHLDQLETGELGPPKEVGFVSATSK